MLFSLSKPNPNPNQPMNGKQPKVQITVRRGWKKHLWEVSNCTRYRSDLTSLTRLIIRLGSLRTWWTRNTLV